MLSYLQSNNLAADVVADLSALQGSAGPNTSIQNRSNESLQSELVKDGESSDSLGVLYPMTPRGTLRRRPSLGFHEEKYVSRTRYRSDNFDGESYKDKDLMSIERQLLLHDSIQLHTLWTKLIEGPSKINLTSHRHRFKLIPNSCIGKDLVQWLLDNEEEV